MQGSLPCGSVVSIYVGLCILILHTYRTQTSYSKCQVSLAKCIVDCSVRDVSRLFCSAKCHESSGHCIPRCVFSTTRAGPAAAWTGECT